MSAKPPDLEPPNFANPGADFTFRPLVPADLSLLHDWMQRPHWCEWWGPAGTLADVAAEYGPLMADRTRVQPYIVLRGGAPFGYIQSYVALNSGGGWWEAETDPGVRGIDQSIADADQLGRGLGTAMVKAFVTTLFADP